jgi:type II secretory pathway pseudopilin PulG
MTRIRAQLAGERGWGLISSVLVVGILLSLSLPLLSLVDIQQGQTANERVSESSFNLAEAALDASVFVLGKDWPARASGAYPPTCTAASTSDLNCPSPDLLTRTYAGGDYTSAGWSVQVRDDTGTEYYDPDPVHGVPARPRYDANGNGKVWVRADAHSQQADRTLVALVRRIDSVIPFPRNAVTAGWFAITTGGNKVVVDTKGKTAQPAPVAVRCTQPAPSPGCLDYRPDHQQVSPDTSKPGHAGTTAISPELLEMMRAKAKALDTYYASCPQSPEGEMVFVEAGDCRYTGGGSANSAASPGIFIVGRGTISFGGNMTYYGLAYAANLQQSTGIVVLIQGAATIVGSIAADGGGGVQIGSSGQNLVYSDTIWPNLTAFSAAAPVQGSWRELPAS